jgi:uncharacterized protein (DUF427 family)
VWDYPRPPRLEQEPRPVKIYFGDELIAETARALRVLETSHPPNIYVPIDSVVPGVLVPNSRHTVCEWKGRAHYFDVRAGGRSAAAAAWGYASPRDGFEGLVDHVSFYPARMDACYLGDELVQAQPGDFYGGWITKDVVGPFKGGEGSWGW